MDKILEHPWLPYIATGGVAIASFVIVKHLRTKKKCVILCKIEFFRNYIKLAMSAIQASCSDNEKTYNKECYFQGNKI